MEAVPSTGVALAELIRKRGRAEGLEGLSGRIRLHAAGAPVGVLKVEDGEVEIEPDGEASTLLTADTEPTLVSLLSGELQVIVACLQGARGRRPRARDPHLLWPAGGLALARDRRPGPMTRDTISILDGNLFVVGNSRATSRRPRPTITGFSWTTPGSCRTGCSPSTASARPCFRSTTPSITGSSISWPWPAALSTSTPR